MCPSNSSTTWRARVHLHAAKECECEISKRAFIPKLKRQPKSVEIEKNATRKTTHCTETRARASTGVNKNEKSETNKRQKNGKTKSWRQKRKKQQKKKRGESRLSSNKRKHESQRIKAKLKKTALQRPTKCSHSRKQDRNTTELAEETQAEIQNKVTPMQERAQVTRCNIKKTNSHQQQEEKPTTTNITKKTRAQSKTWAARKRLQQEEGYTNDRDRRGGAKSRQACTENRTIICPHPQHTHTPQRNMQCPTGSRIERGRRNDIGVTQEKTKHNRTSKTSCVRLTVEWQKKQQQQQTREKQEEAYMKGEEEWTLLSEVGLAKHFEDILAAVWGNHFVLVPETSLATQYHPHHHWNIS